MQTQYHQQQYLGVGGDSYFRNRTPQPPVINHNHNNGSNSTLSSSSMSSPLSSPYDSQNHTNDFSATGTPTDNFMKLVLLLQMVELIIIEKRETIYLKRLHLFYYNG